MTEYLLRDGDELERRRLALLERHHDPETIFALRCTGVRHGWECLDVGAGAGSISRWLQDRGAKVLATDLDVSRLDGVHETLIHDITGDEPLGRTFDLVHARLLLLHLPTRSEVVDRLVALTRPGGWVVLGDIDFTPVALHGNPDPAWERTWAAWCAATQAAGWDLACGQYLAGTLVDAGLEDVAAHCDDGERHGGSNPMVILSLAFERLRPRLIEHGAGDADITAARALLEDPARMFTMPETWTAWGRIPAGRGVAYRAWARRHPWSATLAGSALSAAPLGPALTIAGIGETWAWLAALGTFLVIVAILRVASWRTGRPVLPRMFGG